MNEFERRWKLATDAARRAADDRPLEAPPGFATRVVAHWQSAPATSLTQLWQQLAWRVFGGVAAALLAVVALDVATSPPADPLRPEVGATVGEMFWLQQP